LWHTVEESLGSLAREANKKDPGFTNWLNEKPVGDKTRASEIAEEMVAGMEEERKRLIKVFTATRFTVGGSKARQQKKEIKAVAGKANAEDAGAGWYGNKTAEYYSTLKARALWCKKN
jgi:hypothetical protein